MMNKRENGGAETLLLIDLHAHSSGISRCCRIPAEAVIEEAKRIGLDGIALTNHYQKKDLKGRDPLEYVKLYLEEFHRAKEIGDRIGIRVLYGIEVTMEAHSLVHMLIYGVSEDFLYAHPTLYEYSQETLYRAVKAAGGVLIQAHPYRKCDRLMDTALMDGIEISCHPLYEGTHYAALRRIAERDGLILTCGGDYHADTYRPKCGMYLPDSVTTGEALGAYLMEADTLRMCVQEVDGSTPFDVIYRPARKR
jgi:predicted metal-dependent phosphoesterase TrpH